MRKLFLPEVEMLEDLLGRDFSAWKVPSPERSERIALRR